MSLKLVTTRLLKSWEKSRVHHIILLSEIAGWSSSKHLQFAHRSCFPWRPKRGRILASPYAHCRTPTPSPGHDIGRNHSPDNAIEIESALIASLRCAHWWLCIVLRPLERVCGMKDVNCICWQSIFDNNDQQDYNDGMITLYQSDVVGGSWWSYSSWECRYCTLGGGRTQNWQQS